MIELPDPSAAYEYENGFYLTCAPTRLGKLLAQYDLYRRASAVPGAIVECGVFKGASLARFACFRNLLGGDAAREIVAFDAFGEFPGTDHEPDKPYLQKFVNSAGSEGLSEQQTIEMLKTKGCEKNVRLVAGDINKTVPEFVAANPHLRIALLNLDTDLYEPTATVMKHLFPLIVPGGILMLDDFGLFPGATQAIEEGLKGTGLKVEAISYVRSPSFVVR